MTKEMALELVSWYHQNQRILPWRESHDPYRIWLSEIMLQQTQVDTVIPYFLRFLERFPRVEDLASADSDDVLKLWEGLGYYSRAKRLIPCARQIVEVFAGKFPMSKKDMLSLPGVGSYTAGALLSIAYNQKEPAVDGNVLRVLSRTLLWRHDIAEAKNRKLYEDYLYESGVLPEDMRSFNQGLMELGALICTPKKPKCGNCPVKQGCLAYAQNLQEQLPIKAKKKAATVYEVYVLLIEDDEGFLMFQREPDTLIGGLWALPFGLGDTLEKAKQELDNWLEDSGTGREGRRHACPHARYEQLAVAESTEEYDTQCEHLGQVKHVFSHQIWHMQLYRMSLPKVEISALKEKIRMIESPVMSWVKHDEVKNLAISTAMKKVIGLGWYRA